MASLRLLRQLAPVGGRVPQVLGSGRPGRRGFAVAVSAESTPNPKAMKFVPEGREVLGAGARSIVYRDLYEARGSPLAAKLLSMDGVREVMLSPQHVTVTKATLTDWEHLQEPVEEAMAQFFESAQPVVNEADIDRTTTQFEAGSLEARIVELLEERVKPFVEQDGGDIEFDRFEYGDGTLYLRMKGSCAGCAQSHATLQEGVRNLMDHYIPEVKHIVGLTDLAEEELPRAR